MARLTAAQRRHLPSGMHYAGPDHSFPVGDVGHDKAALAEIGHAPASARPKIRAAAEADLARHGQGKSHEHTPGKAQGGVGDRNPR